MRFRVLLVLGFVAFPLSGARLGKLELTVLPRSGGKILVDVRGEVEEATPSAPLTILHLEGLRRPVVKFYSPDDWRWQRKVDAVRLQVAVPRGAHEFSLQVEALPTGALRVLSDLPARTVRVFLPESWDFPAKAVDRMKFGRHMLAVYEIPGTFPVVIPLGKGKPILFFLIAGGVFLLALGVGSIVFFRRRHPAPVPVEPEVEEVLEEPVEVEPEEETGEELPEVIEPSVAASSHEPSTLTDPFVGLGAPQTPEGEKLEEEEEEVRPAMPAAEPPAAVGLPGEEEPESEDEKLRKLAREVGIPAEGFPSEPSLEEEEKEGFPEPSPLLKEDEGPVSIEEQLLAEQGEVRSIEAELLEESPSPAGLPLEEKPSPSLPEEPEEERGLFAGMTPGETRVEASPTDMLEVGDLPVEGAEALEPEAGPPAPGDEEDLRVEVDEAFLAGAREYGEDAEPAEPASAEEPSSPPSPEPEPPSGSGAPVPPEPAEPPLPPPPPSRQPPPSGSPSRPASPAPGPEEEGAAPRSVKGPFPSPAPPAPQPESSPRPAPPKKPAGPESPPPAPPSPPPGRTPPAPPKKPAGAPPKDREALIREWLLKRKRKKRP